ncbi:MAG: cysteine-rich CWC family protein [Halioglobus sp.]|nr:cysteine-rich CWC family protein [Halioglobus sp.]
MTESEQAASTCPLCGGSNQCAIAAGQPPQSCWCQEVTISPAAREKAAEFATERCICPTCGRPTGDTEDEG